MFWRSWVQIPELDGDFHIYLFEKIVMAVWKDKNKQKKADDGPFLKITHSNYFKLN